MATNFPNGLSSQGVPVLPSGVIPPTTGTYFFVNSVTGSNANTGTDKQHPLATVAAALTKCTANKGDVIVVMPGHAENITNTTDLNINVAGVRIVGLGTGLARPTFTFTTANTATIGVSAANCGMDNCHFIANFLNVASAFTLAAAKDFQLTNSSFVDTSSSLNFLCIVTTGSTDNAADGLLFWGNYVYGLAATDGAVISVLGNILRANLSYNDVDKAATNDAGHFITLSSKIAGGVRILGNVLTVVGSSGALVGVFGTGSGTSSSGIIADNYVSSLDTTTALLFTTGTKISFIQNYYTGAADASGAVWPVADNPA